MTHVGQTDSDEVEWQTELRRFFTLSVETTKPPREDLRNPVVTLPVTAEAILRKNDSMTEQEKTEDLEMNRKEVLEMLYVESCRRVLNDRLKEAGVSSFGVCGLDLSKAEDIVQLASII